MMTGWQSGTILTGLLFDWEPEEAEMRWTARSSERDIKVVSSHTEKSKHTCIQNDQELRYGSYGEYERGQG